MEERYIASVDLGTSKIAVCIARVEEQNVQVVYYKETPSQGIRYSYVYIPGKVELQLRKAINEAQQELKIRIAQVIVGLPRWEVSQDTASAKEEREDQDSLIEESEVRILKTMALESFPLKDPKKEVIYGAVAQSFSTEENINEIESDIVGMSASTLECNFKIFTGSRRYSVNIDTAFKSIGIEIAKKYFTPGITAKAVLKDEQMENGVALIDIGAGVSSVTIFKGKILRYYAAIPFGGNSITRDIQTECNISFDLAENIKMAFGACMPNKLSAHGEKVIQINDDTDEIPTEIPVRYLSEIIDARMKEIVRALLYKIQESGYAKEEKLRSGVVLTGGGADLVNCANLFREMSGYSVKVGTPRPYFSCEGCEESRGASASTSMGMILAAKNDKQLNCTSKPVLPFKTKPAERPAAKPAEPAPSTEAPAVAQPVNAPAAEPVKPAGPTAEQLAAQARKREEEERAARRAREIEEATMSFSIEPSVAAAQEEEESYGGTVFETTTEQERKDFDKAKREKEKQKKPKFSWFVHARKAIEESVGSLYDELDSEDV